MIIYTIIISEAKKNSNLSVSEGDRMNNCRKNNLLSMMMERVLILAEYEETDVFRGLYIDFLRKIEKELACNEAEEE